MTAHRSFDALAASLDAVEGQPIDTRGARAELRALQAILDDMVAHSDLFAEIDAIAARLLTLAASRPGDTWQITETAEQAAAVLREIRSEAFRHRLESDASAALAFVEQSLAGLPSSEVGQLVDAEADEIRTWRERGVPASAAGRVETVSLILDDLLRSMTAEGAIEWFSADRVRLDHRTPLQVLDCGDALAIERLRRLAKSPHSVLVG